VAAGGDWPPSRLVDVPCGETTRPQTTLVPLTMHTSGNHPEGGSNNKPFCLSETLLSVFVMLKGSPCMGGTYLSAISASAAFRDPSIFR
jgi:hypothetical protein